MAISPLTALSNMPAPPAGGDADPQTAYNEYAAAINKVVEALEKRKGINYFNLAGQLFDPGRTGNIGEAIGRGATSVGKDIAEEEAMEPNIAMMRANLAQGKYQMAQKQQGLNTLSSLYPDEETQQVVQGPAATTPGGGRGVVGPATPGAIQPSLTGAAPATRSSVPAVSTGWLPDRKTVNMMLAGSGGEPGPVLKSIAEARIKQQLELAKPTDAQRDLALLSDPNTDPMVKTGIYQKYLGTDVQRDLMILNKPDTDPMSKLIIAQKYLGDSVKPFTRQTAQGSVQTDPITEVKKLLESMSGATTKPPATSGSSTSTSSVPTTAPRPAGPRATTTPETEPITAVYGETITTPDGFKIPVPPAPKAARTPAGFAPSSKEALEARSEDVKQNTDYMYRKDGPLDKARVRAEAANNNLAQYSNIIDSVKNIKGGILAVPLQTWDRVIDTFGFSTPDTYKRMISTGMVDKAAKQVVANDLKAAFGGNPTEGERKYYEQGLINITDPKELILFTAMVKRAAAAKDIARFEYLSDNKHFGLDAEKTFDAWARKQPLAAFEPGLKNLEAKMIPNRGTPEPKPAQSNVRYIGNRAIVPNAANTGWVYQDSGKPVE
jgi:hypothetical protein